MPTIRAAVVHIVASGTARGPPEFEPPHNRIKSWHHGLVGIYHSSGNCSDGTASASTAALRNEGSIKAQESKRQPLQWLPRATHHQDDRHVEVTSQVGRHPEPTVISCHDVSKSEILSYHVEDVGKEKFCPDSNVCQPTSEVGMIPRYLMPEWKSNSVRHASRATKVILLFV